MWNRRNLAGLGLGLAMITSTAGADELHYRDILIGDRASGMGGAYSAVSDDPAGLYYNPAGIVHAGGANLSGSVNAWHQTNTTYKSVLGNADWNRESSSLIPNFFGITQPMGPGVLGFSYVVTDAVQEDQDQTFTNTPGLDRLSINLNDNQMTYKIGPSYALNLNENLAIGLSFFFHFREQELVNNQLIVTDEGPDNQAQDAEWRFLEVQNDEWGIKPVLGVMWDATERIALGGSVRRAEVLEAENLFVFTCHGGSQSEGTLCQQDEIRHVESRDSEKRDHPWEFRLGVAYFHSPRLLVSADASYHTEHDDDVRDRTVEATWNLALGSEYYLNNRFAVRGGLFTNRANTPSQVEEFDHVNFYGASASFAWFSRNSSLSLGIGHSRGDGKGQVFGANSNVAPQSVTATSTTLFLSSVYSF